MENQAEWMRRILKSVICLALILPVFFMAAWAAPEEQDALAYEPNSLLVKISVKSGGLMAMTYKTRSFSQYGDMELLLTLSGETNVSLHTFTHRDEQTSWYALTLNDGQDLEETKSALERETGVLAVTYNYRIYTLDDVDAAEPAVSDVQTYTASQESSQWHLKACGLPEAQSYLDENSLPSGGSEDIIVAVLDSGVDYTHPDLTDNILRSADGSVIGEDATRTTTSDPMPDAGQSDGYHGTHCAGIIAASGKTYVRGVASNVKIMPVKVISTAAANELTLLKGIQFAYAHGAKIVSMSIGMNVAESAEYNEQGLQVALSREVWESAGSVSMLHDAIKQYCGEMIFVAAAGNNSRPNEDAGGTSYLLTYPAAWPEVIGVMSLDQNPTVGGDWLSSFSNWDVNPGSGPEYDIAAPGSKIISTIPTVPYYKTDSGTSMATPYVAGCAALLLTKYIDNSDFTIQDVKRILLETAETKQGRSLDGDTFYCPMVRIDLALAYREAVQVELPAYTYIQLGNDGASASALPSEQNGNKLSYYYSNDTYRGNVAPTKPGTYTVKAEIDSIYYTGEAQGLYTVYQDAGDFNGDGKIDREDVNIYYRHQFGAENADGVIGSRYVAALDFNKDGKINLLDITWMCLLEKRQAENEQ